MRSRSVAAQQEMRIAGEAIELRDHQRRLADAAFRQHPAELRAIVALAALDLDKLRQRPDVEAGKVIGPQRPFNLAAALNLMRRVRPFVASDAENAGRARLIIPAKKLEAMLRSPR
jgi:hypothetical protein